MYRNVKEGFDDTTLYDRNAKRGTVSVTLNADLVAQSSAHGINISRVAEAALVTAFEQAETPAGCCAIRSAPSFIIATT